MGTGNGKATEFAESTITRFRAGELDPTACVLWPFARVGADGYGVVGVPGTHRTELVHRRVCAEAHGEPSSDRPLALHSPMDGGHPKTCINPHHLRWGSKSENLRDAWADGARRAKPRRACTICGRPQQARGLCPKHYMQWRRAR